MEIPKSSLTRCLSGRRCIFTLVVLALACSAAWQASMNSAGAAANLLRSPGGVAISNMTATPGPTPVVAPNPSPSPPTFPGRLDPTFGTGGRVFVDVVFGGLDSSTATACALQSDGKLIIAGSFEKRNSSTTGTHFGLIRLNADGSLDTSFGSGGLATAVFTAVEHATSIALQTDGKILVAGYTGSISDYSTDFILARFNDDGSVDTTFGSAGAVVTDFFNSRDEAHEVIVQPDQKIVVAGQVYKVRSSTGQNGGAFELVRYNPDGSFDSTFGTDGKVTTDFTGTDDGAFAMALQPGGKLVAVGRTLKPAPLYDDFAIARFNSDGSLDSTFDGDGRVTADVGAFDVAQSVVVQPDGKVVVSGANMGGDSTFVVLRYNTDGSPDTTFGATGRVTTNFGFNRGHRADKVFLQPDGKIVVVGGAYGFPESADRRSEWALARYNPNGSLDSTFGTGGMATVYMGDLGMLAHDAVLQPDGKIVAAGDGSGANFDHPAYSAARFLPDNTSPALLPANVSGTKTKTGGNIPGSTVTYTVVLSNSSSFAQPDNPGNEFIDVLPSSLTLVSASATSGTATATIGTNTASWNGSIAGSGSVTITITATINNAPDGMTVSNQGMISYDADGNGTNEASRLTDDPGIGGASDPTTFQVVDVNDPPDAVNDVLSSVAEDSGVRTIPIATLLANDSKGPANESGQTLTLTGVSNSVGGTVTSDATNVYFAPTANYNGPASFQYTVTDNGTTNGVADPKNDTATVSFTVTEVNDAQPDMIITKIHSGSFSQGQVGASYTITVNNISAGPTDGSPVTVEDNVPVGLSPTGPNGVVNGWTCVNGQRLTCTRSDVLSGNASYPSITLTVNVANPAPLNVTNTATVSGGGEVNTSNNTASDSAMINCNSDFSLNNTSPLMISRFRMNGPAGPQDEFVQIYNPSSTAHTVASGNCGGGGYGVFASSGNGTISNAAPLVCYIPNGTVIPAGGYYLCTGATYSLSNLGRNGGAAGATSVSDAPIGCNGLCSPQIPDDAGLALMNVAQGINLTSAGGFLGGVPDAGFVLYDRVGFGPYGGGAPAPGYPSLAGNFCEGAACLKPVGDASIGGACINSSGLFPVFPAPPACYGLAGQYEFLRRQTAFNPVLGTVHLDTNNSANDFVLVAPNSGLNMGLGVTGVSGVTSVLGAAGPQASTSPSDTPSTKLKQSPFDMAVPSFGPRNAERIYSIDPAIANPANNPLGTFTLRLRFTNNSGIGITGLRFRVDQVSTLCGPETATPAVGTGAAKNLSATPDCGAGGLTAIFKLLNSAQEVVVDSDGIAQSVSGTVMEDLSVAAVATPPGSGPLSPNGGGLDSSLVINPSSEGISIGDGVTGGTGVFATAIGTTDDHKVIRIKIKFGVVKNGRFVLLITPMGKTP